MVRVLVKTRGSRVHELENLVCDIVGRCFFGSNGMRANALDFGNGIHHRLTIFEVNLDSPLDRMAIIVSAAIFVSLPQNVLRSIEENNRSENVEGRIIEKHGPDQTNFLFNTTEAVEQAEFSMSTEILKLPPQDLRYDFGKAHELPLLHLLLFFPKPLLANKPANLSGRRVRRPRRSIEFSRECSFA